MIELTARFGYAEVSVARLCRHAGVSTQSFYECFEEREDCLLAAREAAAHRILGGLPPAAGQGSADVLRRALDGVLRALARDPDAGRVLLIEALAGGPRVQAHRRQALAHYERCAESLLDGSRGSRAIDIPASALIGALRGVVAQRLRAEEQDQLPLLLDDLLAWIESYAIADGAARSSADSPLLTSAERSPAPSPAKDACALNVPRLPRGRHTTPPRLAERIQRKRIIHGTAQATSASGYAEVSVSKIVAASHISRQIFYEQFPNKQQAFVAAQQHATVEVLVMCWEAYFATDSWPERVWNVLETLTSLIAANPALTHLRIVDCYAAGPDAVRWTEELVSATAIFLKEGYRTCPLARKLPALSSQAIVGTVYELIQRDVAHGRTSTLPLRLPLLTYLAIAPFTGPLAAVTLVREFSAKSALIAASTDGD